MGSTAVSRGNRLLDRMVVASPRLGDAAELERLTQGDRIESHGDALFPVGSVVALIATSWTSASVEIAMTGCEGVVGGDDGASALAAAGIAGEVTIGGSAWRVTHRSVADAVDAEPSLAALFAAYRQFTVASIARQAFCNLLHTVDQRVCRWLLTTGDRVGDDDFAITQSFLSERLGVRRASVNVVERRLASRGAIEYGAGRMRISDRRQLVDQSCDCYALLSEHLAASEG